MVKDVIDLLPVKPMYEMKCMKRKRTPLYEKKFSFFFV